MKITLLLKKIVSFSNCKKNHINLNVNWQLTGCHECPYQCCRIHYYYAWKGYEPAHLKYGFQVNNVSPNNVQVIQPNPNFITLTIDNMQLQFFMNSIRHWEGIYILCWLLGLFVMKVQQVKLSILHCKFTAWFSRFAHPLRSFPGYLDHIL